MLTEGPDALKGYLRACKYRTAIHAPSAIAKRGLPFLDQISVLQKQGTLKQPPYFLRVTGNGSSVAEQDIGPSR